MPGLCLPRGANGLGPVRLRRLVVRRRVVGMRRLPRASPRRRSRATRRAARGVLARVGFSPRGWSQLGRGLGLGEVQLAVVPLAERLEQLLSPPLLVVRAPVAARLGRAAAKAHLGRAFARGAPLSVLFRDTLGDKRIISRWRCASRLESISRPDGGVCVTRARARSIPARR